MFQALFSNFVFAIIFCFILTRIGKFFLNKLGLRREVICYLSSIIVAIIVLPFIIYFINFDIVIAEYVFALILCLVFDLLLSRIKFKKK